MMNVPSRYQYEIFIGDGVSLRATSLSFVELDRFIFYPLFRRVVLPTVDRRA